MKITLASLSLLMAAAPAAAQDPAERVLEAIRGGRVIETARVDESAVAWTVGEIDHVLTGTRALIEGEDGKAKAAALALRKDLQGLAERVARPKVRSDADPAVIESSLVLANAAVHLTTELGDAGDMIHAARHATNLFMLQRSRREPRAMVVRLVTETMDGDPRAVAGLRSAYRAVDATVARALIDGFINRQEAGDASIAAGLLGEQPSVDAHLLSRLLLMLRQDSQALDEIDLGRVRTYLTHAEPGCRAGAARVAGRTVDFEATSGLLDLMEDDVTTVVSAAHRALQDITDLRFGPSARRWRLWHQRETAWWNSKGQALVEALPKLRREHRINALNELASHPLKRRQITPAVEPFLQDRDPGTVMMALSVLESARSKSSAPRIEALLRHPSSDVKILASKVLASLTGRQRGAADRRVPTIR